MPGAGWLPHGRVGGPGDMTVVARTTCDARVVAAGCELGLATAGSAPGDDVATMGASAFRNEKLYTVIEVDRNRLDLQRGLISQ